MFAAKTTVHKRIFTAFLDLAILVALKNRDMTGYGINNHFMQKLGNVASPSALYNRLAELEREGLITCVRDKRGRTYGLPDNGRKAADRVEVILEEVKRFLDKLLKS